MPNYKLQVEVIPQYLPEQSDPAGNLYTFAYSITITNKGNIAAQGGNPPPPPPPPSWGGKLTSSDEVSDYLTTLISSLTSNTDRESTVGTTDSEFNQLLKTASDLLGAKGNLVDRAV